MDDDWDWDARGEYEAELIEKGIANLRDDQVRDYLGTFGDAVQERVDACVKEAMTLEASGHPAVSLVRSVTATELVIHYMILRPILSGAFLSEEWAQVLLKRILSQRSASDRELLPAVLRAWEIDLNSLILEDGSPLWQTFIEQIVPKRNAVVHQGAAVDSLASQLSLVVHETFVKQIVVPLSRRLGFSWSASHRWSEIRAGIGGATTPMSFPLATPFGE